MYKIIYNYTEAAELAQPGEEGPDNIFKLLH